MLLKKKELAAEVTAKMAELGLKSEPAFVTWLSERGCKLHQTTLNRVLNLRIKEDSRRVRELCKYAEIDIEKFVVRTAPQKSALLMDALAEAWDGSKPQEKWLARVIKTAGAAPPVT